MQSGVGRINGVTPNPEWGWMLTYHTPLSIFNPIRGCPLPHHTYIFPRLHRGLFTFDPCRVFHDAKLTTLHSKWVPSLTTIPGFVATSAANPGFFFWEARPQDLFFKIYFFFLHKQIQIKRTIHPSFHFLFTSSRHFSPFWYRGSITTSFYLLTEINFT